MNGGQMDRHDAPIVQSFYAIMQRKHKETALHELSFCLV
jgi:hypothetical protein